MERTVQKEVFLCFGKLKTQLKRQYFREERPEGRMGSIQALHYFPTGLITPLNRGVFKSRNVAEIVEVEMKTIFLRLWVMELQKVTLKAKESPAFWKKTGRHGYVKVLRGSAAFC